MLTSLIILTGLLIGIVIIPQWSLIEKAIIGIGINLGVVTLFGTISLLTAPLNTNSLIMIGFLMLIILFGISVWKSYLPKRFSLNIKGFGFFEYVLFGAMLSLFITILLSTYVWPVNAWDAIALYDFRGRFFSEGNSLYQLMRYVPQEQIISGKVYYLSYPLLTSIIHAVSYFDGITNPKWIYAFFSIGSYILFYNFLVRNSVTRIVSLILTIIFTLMTFKHAIIAYTNIPYMFYVSFGFLYLYEWVRTRDPRLIILSTILIIFSTQVRNLEQFYLIFIFMLMIYTIHGKYFLPLSAAIIVFLSGQFWGFVANHLVHGENSNISSILVVGTVSKELGRISLTRLSEVLTYFLSSAAIYLPLFLVFTVIVYYWLRNKDWKKGIYKIYYPVLISVFLFFMLAGTYFFSFTNESWNLISGSLTRALIPLIPIMLAFIGLEIYSSKR